MNIVLLGKPASGKGTQARILSEKLHYFHLSPGQQFGKLIKENGPLSQEIEHFYQAGELVPDSITTTIVRKFIEEHSKTSGIIFDGYPRDTVQAMSLKQLLHAAGSQIDLALLIDIADKEVIRRITGRRICSTDQQHIFHLIFNPPKKKDICDFCGGALYQREDDSEESALRRVDVFYEETHQLIKLFEQEKILYSINGKGSIDTITQNLEKVIHEHKQ